MASNVGNVDNYYRKQDAGKFVVNMIFLLKWFTYFPYLALSNADCVSLSQGPPNCGVAIPNSYLR